MFFEVIPPVVYLRVTENVPHIVAFIERIIKNGHAYATQEGEYLVIENMKLWLSVPNLSECLETGLVAGDVYFDIQSIGDRYGKFGGAVDSQGEPGECYIVSHFSY